MMRSPALVLVSALLVSLTAVAGIGPSRQTATDAVPKPSNYVATDLDPQGERNSAARAINETGQIVGMVELVPNQGRAVLWQDGRIIELTTLGGPQSQANAINASGEIVGQADGGGSRPVLWRDGAITELDTLGGREGAAAAINDAGLIVGNAETADNIYYRGALWQDGQPVDLEIPTGDFGFSSATAINGVGQVVGFSFAMPGAFLWQDGTITPLGTLGGELSVPTDINKTGQIVGYSSTATDLLRAVQWQDGQVTDLGTLGGLESEAHGINDAGWIVGRAQTRDGAWHACLWQEGEIIDLDTLGGEESWAFAINEAGHVVGWAQTADGSTHAVLWSPA